VSKSKNTPFEKTFFYKAGAVLKFIYLILKFHLRWFNRYEWTHIYKK